MQAHVIARVCKGFLRDKRPCGEKDGLVVVEDRQLRDTVSVQSYMNADIRFQNTKEIHKYKYNSNGKHKYL